MRTILLSTANLTSSRRPPSVRHWPVGLPGLMNTRPRTMRPSAFAVSTVCCSFAMSMAQPLDSSR